MFIDEELDDKKPLIVSGMKILLNEQSLKVMEREERGGEREGGRGRREGREGREGGREGEGGREREAHMLLLLFFQ